MSKHNHGAIGHDVNYIIQDVMRLPKEEAENIYGIEFTDDGKVFDPTYNQAFESVGEWAQFSVEQDQVEYSEHFTYDSHEGF